MNLPGIFFCLGIYLAMLAACSPAEKSKGMAQKVIFDTDMGSDCDDVGALALLHSYADEGKADILACIYSSGTVPYGAGVTEAINIYYGRGEIPIGANQDAEVGDPVDKMSAEKLAKDQAAFGNTIVHNQDAADQTKLNRKILALQDDNSVDYITVGHTKGLYDLLMSEPDNNSPLNGKELIAKKVRRWIALGALNANNPQGHYIRDWNFFFNKTTPYTAYLVQHFPSDIVFVDAGSKVMTGASLKNTQAGNIVRTAYRDWLWNVEKKTIADQRPSWDLATVYYALEGTGEFLEDAGVGYLDFDVEKGCRWISDGNRTSQRFIMQKPNSDAAFAEYLNERISRQPGK
ncbi:MAG: nucleoside hydrolase [Cyclobacteriaceae bacterium]|nr:nucleoside hydrolase [Cyclobacteriaceae bacterium]